MDMQNRKLVATDAAKRSWAMPGWKKDLYYMGFPDTEAYCNIAINARAFVRSLPHANVVELTIAPIH